MISFNDKVKEASNRRSEGCSNVPLTKTKKQKKTKKNLTPAGSHDTRCPILYNIWTGYLNQGLIIWIRWILYVKYYNFYYEIVVKGVYGISHINRKFQQFQQYKNVLTKRSITSHLNSLNKTINHISSQLIKHKKSTTCDVGNPGLSLEHTQKEIDVKPFFSRIPTLPSW